MKKENRFFEMIWYWFWFFFSKVIFGLKVIYIIVYIWKVDKNVNYLKSIIGM